MKKGAVAVAVAVLSLAFAGSVFAVEGGQPQKGPGPNFDQRKAEILKMLDERVATLQEEKGCVQAAKNHDDLKACRKKHKQEMEKMRDEMKEKRGKGGHEDQK